MPTYAVRQRDVEDMLSSELHAARHALTKSTEKTAKAERRLAEVIEERETSQAEYDKGGEMMEAKIQQLEAQVYALQHKQSYHPEAVEQPNLPAVAQKEIARAKDSESLAVEELTSAKQRLLEQEMSSNARILEIKGLLDAERLAKAEAIAKVNAQMAALKRQLKQEQDMAEGTKKELKAQLANKTAMYEDMSEQAAKKYAAVQDQFEDLNQQLLQKSKEYSTLCQAHESVAAQVVVLKKDVAGRKAMHAKALEEHAETVAALNATIEANKAHDLKQLQDTVAEHEQICNKMRHDHLTVQRDLQGKHHHQIHEIATGKDAALQKTLSSHDQEVRQLLAQYENRVGALEDCLATEKANFASKCDELASTKRRSAEELEAAVARERALQVQLTDQKHKTHTVSEDLATAEKRVATVIREDEAAQASLRSVIQEKEVLIQDLKAEVVATRNQMPPVMAAHKAAMEKFQAEKDEMEAKYEKQIVELEAEMAELAQQLEDTTRNLWNVTEDRNMLSDRLERAIAEHKATVRRMEREKAEALEALQGQLYSTRQQLSMTENTLSETRRELQAAIKDGNDREAAAINARHLSERSAKRVVERKDREIGYIATEKEESVAVALGAKNESSRLRKDLRHLLSHNAKVEKNNADMVGTVHELQGELNHQAEMMEAESNITYLKQKKELDEVSSKANKSIRSSRDRAERSERMEELMHQKLMRLQLEYQ